MSTAVRGLLEMTRRAPGADPRRVRRRRAAGRRGAGVRGAEGRDAGAGVRALEARLDGAASCAYADLPGAGAAGGLGAALASLGARAPYRARELVLDELGFDPSGYDLVVTGEGTVDATTVRGKAPGEVARRCAERRACAALSSAAASSSRSPVAETVGLSVSRRARRRTFGELGPTAWRSRRGGLAPRSSLCCVELADADACTAPRRAPRA